ncbi:hypothetical protein Pflav_072000 [Phytohabitans flavus]|uniref:Uncharacterized protein n=1 Tax=Phytohabitans flavus TaxID=1076124 RepID=A0A6F8Y404_9ACTN|nr:hypothetical protein Pflav_072000 [Phytohabitans flavus]
MVAAEDVYLLDRVVDQQRLEPAQSDQLGGDLVEQHPLLDRLHRGSAAPNGVRVLRDDGHRQPYPLDVLLLGRELAAALPLGQPFGELAPQLTYHGEVGRLRRRGRCRRRRPGREGGHVVTVGGLVAADVHLRQPDRWRGRGRLRLPRARVVGDRLKPHPVPPRAGFASPAVRDDGRGSR